MANSNAKKQEEFVLTITADDVTSTDERFTMGGLSSGKNYKPLSAVFQKADGKEINREYNKGERRISNKTMPRIIFQIYEKQISALSVEEKKAFPVYRDSLEDELICGIFQSVDEFKKYRNSMECVEYSCDDGRKFVIYCWNVFSTIIFVQECLKRFGESGDKFILTYREKEKEEAEREKIETSSHEEMKKQSTGYKNPYSKILIESKNIILRGAPGTGKSYLAKEIATDIISNGYFDDYTLLSDEQKKQVEFVQFHPSYDYSDFVEGLRPQVREDGSMGFILQDGVFKKFIARARKNYENSHKSEEDIEKEMSVQNAINEFFEEIENKELKTIRNNKFEIKDIENNKIQIYIPNNPTSNSLYINMDDLKKMLESKEKFTKSKDVTDFFKKSTSTQGHSYYYALYKEIKKKMNKPEKTEVKQEELNKYIFIIDEINRGEISKIFGELFFSIDPGYRGKAGEVSTKYANLRSSSDDKFYIPENVYIIGTMNDIDRSVDSFDFAMRRRFRFIEIKADARLEMLDSLDNEDLKSEAIRRMTALNEEIIKVDELNENYQIGASYFLKLKNLTFDQLWTDYLKPLLKDYIQGMYDEKAIMDRFAKAYGYNNPVGENLL